MRRYKKIVKKTYIIYYKMRDKMIEENNKIVDELDLNEEFKI